ncbi:hypothetical protein GLOTRDRAFT_133207 [Gloeophyllum trabeum ATCC 11539]|uniref:DUF6534 domain-containing protein n=1 Tax=Gloeophyllum trabeum (strain ATCC 11539 / FP-39264 / Madison 617) TaxID=670483 RepID=S7PVA3_GLOTA|nr:uncharacterized protein GLOTRDRAFT_133207 [Gloeophyllum trabeum ATCC 11539]EPQ51337.1 hypothetical protein GLOTRDRAFT_133207 [Gloeophyllum trabeum ATCC 11539]
MCGPDIPSDIAGQNGPLLMGYLFSYLLQGILIVQVFIFCSQPTYATDRLPIKVTVWIVFCLEIVSTAFATVSAWYGLASGWGDPRTLINPSWAFAYTPALHGIIALSVQLFFCWRMTLFGSGFVVPSFIATVCLMQSAMAIACGVKIWELPDLDAIYGIIPFVSVWLGGSAFCDIMIAINMVYLLYRAGREADFKATYHLLLRPIMICVETGIMTACSSIMHLVLFLAIRNDNAHFTFLFLTAKLYSNTLLATLNKGQSSWEAELDRIQPSRLSGRTPATVFITTSTSTHKDDEAVLDIGHANIV